MKGLSIKKPSKTVRMAGKQWKYHARTASHRDFEIPHAKEIKRRPETRHKQLDQPLRIIRRVMDRRFHRRMLAASGNEFSGALASLLLSTQTSFGRQGVEIENAV